jgi:hypothetical protein
MRWRNAVNESHVLEMAAAAEESVDGDGELPYAVRWQLQQQLEGIGQVWPRLEIVCARRVIPIWRAGYQSDEPATLLDLAEQHLERGGREKELRIQREIVDDLLLELGVNEEERGALPAGYAGSAAIAATWAALGERLPGRGLPEGESDAEDWTAAFFASIAWSGGATWEGSVGNADLRREFWLWYLREAIPGALRQGVERSGSWA